MNSLTLQQNGFPQFVPLKEVSVSSLPANQCAVIVLADNTSATDSDSVVSNVLYIGKAKKLSKRIFGGYLGGFGGKSTKKINCYLFDEGFLDKVSISWMLTDDPKAKQQELLDSFKKDHAKYPIWNAQKKVSRSTQPIAQPTSKPVKATATRRRSPRTRV